LLLRIDQREAALTFPSNLLVAADLAGVCSAYYELCSEYPNVLGSTNVKLPYKAILEAAKEKIALTKLLGPGIVFQVGGLPEGVWLNLIVQSGGSVETYFVIRQGDDEYRGTFAILCNQARVAAGRPDPQYPRPICTTASGMVAAFAAIKELTLQFAKGIQPAEIR